MKRTGRLKPLKKATATDCKGFCKAVKDELIIIFNPINKNAYLMYSANKSAVLNASFSATGSRKSEVILSGIIVKIANMDIPINRTEMRASLIKAFIRFSFFPP